MGTLKTNFGRKQKWRNDAIAYLVNELTNLGQEACIQAIQQRGYQNRLGNLHDSIGSAVYVDGKLVPSSRRYAESPISSAPYKNKGKNGNGEYMNGRQAIDDYWSKHQELPRSKNAVELVVIAATFYAGILEAKGVQVISAAASYVQGKLNIYKSYNPKIRGFADLVSV